MVKTKKIIVVLIAISIISINPIISFASEKMYYSSLPEPQPSNNVKYFITDPKTNDPRLFVVSVPAIVQDDFAFQINTFMNDSIQYIEFDIFSVYGISFNVTLLIYDLSGNLLSNRKIAVPNNVDMTRLIYYEIDQLESYENFDIPVNDTDNILNVPKTNIAWSATTNPITYTQWLERILAAITDSNSKSQQQTDEIISNQSQNTDDIISNQSQNTQDIIDNQNQLQENEKIEADSSGNNSINSIVGGIENKGEGFFSSMGNLISVMSYNGTNCKWNLPPITLPKIDGVMDSITLTDNLEIDFEYWIGQIPSTIMRVVQAISTIALILFCVKELYSVLSYVFTLRGG